MDLTKEKNMNEIGLFMPLVGDVVKNGSRYAIVTRRRILKNGKQSKLVTLMYSDGSFRTVNVRFCSPVAIHDGKIEAARSRLKEMESKEDEK